MKKIGIITIHRYNNWGSVLQAFALNKYLWKKGFDVKTIDYLNKDFTKDKINFLYKQEFNKHKKSFILTLKFLLLYPKFFVENKKWIKLFVKFKQKFLPMTEPCYNKNDINNLGLNHIILGSDQIWGKPRDIYYGYGLSGNIISFSASMPREKYEKFTKKDEEQVKKYLNNLNYISVREESSVNYLSKITEKKIINTIDPVFLLNKEDYKEIVDNSKVQIKEKYILIYLLYSVKENNILLEIANKLKEIYGYKIINISIKDQKIQGSENFGYIGPCECLYLIKNAEFVLTNSFHGSVLSMVFEKNFYTITYREPDRLYNILEKAQLMDRLIGNVEDMTLENIDYEKVWKNLSPIIEDSKIYLTNALN